MIYSLVKMLLNESENEKLFAKSVPVYINRPDVKNTRPTHLFLTMEWQEASTGMYNKKVLSISLTNNEDPFFLFNLQLSEEDFLSLKDKQGIRINFASLPQHIIVYSEKSLSEENSPQPRFMLVFNYSDNHLNVAELPQLDIIETNEFKNLTHLSLKFIAATDSAKRQHINSSLRNLKEKNRQLNNNIAFLEQNLKDKLTSFEHTLKSKVQELESVKKELNEELTIKDNRHQSELQEERDKLINRHKGEVNRLEIEINEKEYNFRKEIQQLESRLHTFENLNKELHEKNLKNESTIRELNSKILSLEDETKCVKENLQRYKYKCDSLQDEVRGKMSHIRQQDERIDGLQQELRNKEQTILKKKDEIEVERERKTLVENELDEVKFRLDMSEKQRQVLEIDREKLNKVIIEMQDKTKEISKEEKNKNHLLAKYKRLIEEKENALLDINHEIGELKLSLQTKNVEVKSFTDSNYILQKNLEDTRRVLKDRDSVIKFLNGKVTTLAEELANLKKECGSPPDLNTSPSAIAQKQLAEIRTGISPFIPGKNRATKNKYKEANYLESEAASPVCRGNNSIPSRCLKTPGTDSAYCTALLPYNQTTTKIIAGSHNVNFDSEKFEIDQEVLSGTFGDGNHILKHSTAKKPTKPVNSNTPKISKKR